MAETPKEFPQTGADGQGQVSPPMGEFWLPHGNSAPPHGIRDDFSGPSYMAGAGDVYVPDYHPPERIPAHPFKVERYYDNEVKEWKLRVREGRFYLTTNTSSTAGKITVAVPSEDQAVEGATEFADIFQVIGDGGFPSFGNTSSASLAPALALAKEFTDDDAANGYAVIPTADDGYAPDKVNWVHLRYILKYGTGNIELAGVDNDLNIVSIQNDLLSDEGSGAVNKPISPAEIVDKQDDEEEDPILEIMRADPDPAINTTLNSLPTGGAAVDRLRMGVYYILLAKVEATGTKTGPIITQYIHENITLSVSTTPVTDFSESYGS